MNSDESCNGQVKGFERLRSKNLTNESLCEDKPMLLISHVHWSGGYWGSVWEDLNGSGFR